MSGKPWLFAGVAAVLLSGPGCVSFGQDTYGAAFERGAECEIPSCQRNQVYLFAMSGLVPAEMSDLESLRENLGRQGFAKVGTGQTIHVGWMLRQMREIRAQEPDAVFVVLGMGGGTSAAARLAEQARAKGLPVAGVIQMAADGKTPAPEIGVPALAIPTGAGDSVTAVAEVLREVARATTPPTVEHVTGWWYPDAPAARPLVEIGSDLNWAFLFDQPGVVPPAIGYGQPTIIGRLPPSPYTSAIR